MTGSTLTVAAAVARTELRRTVRNFDTRRRVAVVLAMLGLFGLLVTAGGAVGAFLFGRLLRTGELAPADVRPLVHGATTGIVLGTAFLSAMRTAGDIGSLDEPAGVLTATTHPPVAVGVVVAELARWAALVAVPLAGLVVGLTLGTGSVLAGQLLVVVALTCLVVGLLAGFVVGLAGKTLAARSRFVARHRDVLTVVWAVGLPFVWVMLASRVPAAIGRVTAAVPTGVVGELLFVGLPVAARVGDALAGMATMVLAGGVLLAASVRLAGVFWYVDRDRPESGRQADESTGVDPTGPLVSLTTPAVAAVARKSWRRGRRAPFTLQWGWVPLFGLISPLQSLVVGDFTFPLVGPFVGLVLAMAAGGAFTLNPVGGEGAALPVVLTSRVSGRSFVGGLVLAGGAPGVVVSAVGVLGVGLLAGLPTATVGWALVYAMAMTAAAPPLASGFGAAFPKFETREVGGIASSREAVVPSGWAFLYYAVALVLVGLPGLLAQSTLVSGWVASLAGTTPALVTVVGVAGTVVLAATAAGLSFRHAVGVCEGYRL